MRTSLLTENLQTPRTINKHNCGTKINSYIRRNSGRTDNVLEKTVTNYM